VRLPPRVLVQTHALGARPPLVPPEAASHVCQRGVEARNAAAARIAIAEAESARSGSETLGRMCSNRIRFAWIESAGMHLSDHPEAPPSPANA
jgi:hypothetical protein